MVITYGGGALIKISSGETVIAVNPHNGEEGRKSVRFGADIVCAGRPSPLFGSTENASFGGRVPFVIDGPGEYEVGGVFVRGIQTDIVDGPKGKKEINTTFSILVEGVTIVHFGGHEKSELSAEAKEAFPDIDILFLPIGGEGTLDGVGATKIATALAPKVVIPVCIDGKKGKEELSKFLKEWGEKEAKAIPKYVLKKKDLEGKEGEVIILEAQ
jgi:L-ascorbate metabolism protein UlaG (beta-lactamase superfamily)